MDDFHVASEEKKSRNIYERVHTCIYKISIYFWDIIINYQSKYGIQFLLLRYLTVIGGGEIAQLFQKGEILSLCY